MREGPSARWNSGRSRMRVSVQVTSPAPPAVGLSPMSLRKKGCLSLFSARAIASSYGSVGATNSKFVRAVQKLAARPSAAVLTAASSSPVTITAAWLRGSSAQA